MLLDDFRGVEGIASYHMECKVNSNLNEKIQLLYKFRKGECPKSFGMNVAMMSGIDLKIV
jgi:DNA mismatch repair protein MSH6